MAWVGDSIATIWKNGTPLCLVNKHVPERHVRYKLHIIYLVTIKNCVFIIFFFANIVILGYTSL